MTSNIDKQLYKKYSNLPKDIQNVLTDEDLGPWIHSIGKKHGINPIQGVELEDEIAFVLLGIKNKKDLISNIVKNIGLDEERAIKLVHDIELGLFEDLRESLEKIQPIKESSVEINAQEDSVFSEPTKKEFSYKSTQMSPFSHPIPPEPAATNAINHPNSYNPPVSNTQQSSPKPIVGADKVGLGVPSPITPRERAALELQNGKGEHMFEKKLRDHTQVKPKQVVKPVEHLQQEQVSQKVDPYREIPE